MNADTKTILLVEDTEDIRLIFQILFKELPYTLIETDSGKKAISLASKTSIDLVILDIGLPDIPGYEVCKSIRSFSNVPIMIVSAQSIHDDNDILSQENISFFLKPFNNDEIKDFVTQIFSNESDK